MTAWDRPNPRQRNEAVAATLSTSLDDPDLDPDRRRQACELAVFPAALRTTTSKRVWNKSVLALILVGLSVSTGVTSAGVVPPPRPRIEVPTVDDVAAVRRHLDAARAALGRVTAERRALLAGKLAKAEAALSRFERLADANRSRRRGHRAIYAAGAMILADDLSGVGAADDVVLPSLAIALLVVQIGASGATPPADLRRCVGRGDQHADRDRPDRDSRTTG